jgi:type VI secretion system protein ImpG
VDDYRSVRQGGDGLREVSFQAELLRLRSLAAGFAEAYPAIAPLLAGPLPDPDVERLLDGVAYQNQLLDRKLQGDFPELVQSLAQLILPQYMRPFPASTIVQFTPKQHITQSVSIPAGAELASVPVDGTICRFTTSCDLLLDPVQVSAVAVRQASADVLQIQLTLAFFGECLSLWRPPGLRLYLADDYAAATELYRLLQTHLLRIVVASEDGTVGLVLPPESLRPLGFCASAALQPMLPHVSPGYRLLQEYFIAPEKFLFFELIGLDGWVYRDTGRQFTITFDVAESASSLPHVSCGSFVLNAVPAVNLFSHEAIPVRLDHQRDRYLVRPCGSVPNHFQIVSVDSITGVTVVDGCERSYREFDVFTFHSSALPVYQAHFAASSLGSGHQVVLDVAYPPGVVPDREILSMDITCSNGELPYNLRIGDVCRSSAGVPATVSCTNIAPVTRGVPPPLGPALLWRLTTHLYLNHVSLGSIDHLRLLLQLYVPPEHTADISVRANQKRLAGIEAMSCTPATALLSGVACRGSDITLTVRRDHFAGSGDVYLFGCILDHFFAEYAAVNTFTRLTVEESGRGVRYRWPLRYPNTEMLC